MMCVFICVRVCVCVCVFCVNLGGRAVSRGAVFVDSQAGKLDTRRRMAALV